MTKHNMEVSYFPSKENADNIEIHYEGKILLAFWPERNDVLVDVENMQELGLVLTPNKKLNPRVLTEPFDEDEEPEEVTFKTGQRFDLVGFPGNYLLAQVDYRKACLVNLDHGNRLRSPVEVDDIYNITEEDMLSIAGDNEYSLIE